MNSKVTGIMLILGPILTMGVWLSGLVPDTENIPPSQAIVGILADKNIVIMGSILQIFGVILMFTGLII